MQYNVCMMMTSCTKPELDEGHEKFMYSSFMGQLCNETAFFLNSILVGPENTTHQKSKLKVKVSRES
jgi:hypothetical protein